MHNVDYLNLLLSNISFSHTFFLSFTNRAKKRENRKYAKKERKSRACLEVVKDFSAQIYRHKTESKFVPQNLTTSMIILGSLRLHL